MNATTETRPNAASLSSRFERSVSNLFRDMAAPAILWNRTTIIPFFMLFILWAALMRLTWATWGYMAIDCGRGNVHTPVAG